MMIATPGIAAETALNNAPKNTQKNASATVTENVGDAHKPTLKTLKGKPWYDKINTFASVGLEKRSLQIQRRSTVAVGAKETFSGDYDAQLVSLTSGGNLLKNTSLYFDLTFTKLKLDGRQKATESEPVSFERNKTLLELFADHQLSRHWSLGVDIYYGGDYYRRSGNKQRSYDEEMGADLSLSRQFTYPANDIKLSYIFSHRKINLSDNDSDDSSKRFHNILATITHRWSYGLSSDLNLRGSYYPVVNEFNYWEAETIWSIGTRLNYRLGDKSELVLNLDRLAYGSHSFSSIISLNYQHQFGDNQSRRRKRRNRLPRLLIK